MTRHAVAQLRARRPHLFPVEVDDWQVRCLIRREIEDALAAGRVSDEKPVGFWLHGHKRTGRLPESQRIVWNASGELGWIIAADDAVITSLTRTRSV